MNYRSLTVVLVVVLAGCIGLFGADDTPTPVTPVEVAQEPAPGIPALQGDGASQLRVDTDRLLAANERVRANDSYTVDRSVTIRGSDGRLRIRHVQKVGADGAVLEHVRTNGTGQLSPVLDTGTLWADNSVRWSRVTMADGRTVTTELLSLDSSPYLTTRPLPERVLSGAEFAVTRRDGSVILESIGAVEVRDPIVPLPVGEPRNASVRAVVESDGLVSGLNVSYDALLGDDRLSVTVSHRVVDRGTPTVSRPDWVPDETTE